MKRIYIYGFIISAVLLITSSSCQVTNKYTSPEIDTSGLFRDMQPEDTTSIANIPWKEYFKDPSLQALIQEGLANNYDLKIAYTRIQQAEANLGMAKAAYFPDVALVGQVTHARGSVDPATGKEKVLGTHQEQYSLGISASWELDVWGKLNRQSRSSYAQFLSSHAYRNLIQTSLIANIATSYYSLLALDEQSMVTEEVIGLLQESVETMQAMMQAGMMNAAGIEQSKSLLYSTQISLQDMKTQIRQMENSLCVMLGRDPGPIERTVLTKQEVIPQLAYGIPMQLLSKRPDVMQAELAFRSAFELTNAAQASFYPSITLGTGSMIGYGATTLSKFFQPENIFANIIGGLAQPIFAKKQLTGQLKIRKAQQEEALLNFEKTVLMAGQEVSDILFSYDSSLKKNGIREKQVQATNTAVDFTKELLKAGEVNYLEVITAQQDMLQARIGQVNDKLEQLQYSVTLYKALGGGIQ
ncbi:MAG: efflux transporter outer membrane subunit [Bacteroidales bacterium]|nr:efflux transporter outer membrane subunit [Bacteroidales bacterium]